jgi:chaperonin GroEL (HSP60 family)
VQDANVILPPTNQFSAMKTRITNAKIACLDINLQKQRMQLGVQIVVEDPDQLEAIRRRCRAIFISKF